MSYVAFAGTWPRPIHAFNLSGPHSSEISPGSSRTVVLDGIRGGWTEAVRCQFDGLGRVAHVVALANLREMRLITPDGGKTCIEPEVPQWVADACEIAVLFPEHPRNRGIITKHVDDPLVGARFDDLTAEELLKRSGRP